MTSFQHTGDGCNSVDHITLYDKGWISHLFCSILKNSFARHSLTLPMIFLFVGLFVLFVLFFFFVVLLAMPVSCGSSQARHLTRATTVTQTAAVTTLDP